MPTEGCPEEGPRRPLGLAWGMGLREEAVGPGPPVQEGAVLSSSCLGQCQAQDEVALSLLSGGLLASLSGVLASPCPAGKVREQQIFLGPDMIKRAKPQGT